MQRIFFLTLVMITLLVGHVSAQEPKTDRPRSIRTTFYYDLKWQLTTEEKSYFHREAIFDFTDMVFDGVFRDYNKNNVLIAEGYYEHGVRTGLQTEYYPNRKIRSIIEYHGTNFDVWEYHAENGLDSVAKGTGNFQLTYFYQSGLVGAPTWKQGHLSGIVRGGKRVGTWLYKDLSGVKTDEEYYANGLLSKRVHYSEQGTVELDYNKVIYVSVSALFTENMVYDHETFGYLNEFFESKPTYPASFYRGVSYPNGLKYLIQLFAQTMVSVPGQVSIVRLRVDEHGKITKSGIVVSADPTTDAEAMNALHNHELRFFPAMKNGQPVASIINLPIGAGDEWIAYVKGASLEELLSMQ